jgi:nucleoside-diphosphate-sugar epimerase
LQRLSGLTKLKAEKFVDDLADACVHLLEAYGDEVPINVGSGADLTIAELAATYRWYLEHAAPGAPASAPARAEEAAQ